MNDITPERAKDEARQGGFERRAFDSYRLKARRSTFEFPLDIPKHWLAGNPARTHMMNALNLCAPAFERMAVRFVRAEVLPRLEDPRLREQARGYLGQEAQHSATHTKFDRNFAAQGYDVGRFQRVWSWILDDLCGRRIGVKLNLAHMAAFEHFTDVLVLLIARSDFFDGCDARMKAFYEWHAAEEIEHNAVLYDALVAIDRSYLLRMAGAVLGLAVLLGMLFSSSVALLHQDKKLFERATLREFVEVMFTRYGIVQRLVVLTLRYARPSFRPGQDDDAAFARAVLDPPAATA